MRITLSELKQIIREEFRRAEKENMEEGFLKDVGGIIGGAFKGKDSKTYKVDRAIENHLRFIDIFRDRFNSYLYDLQSKYIPKINKNHIDDPVEQLKIIAADPIVQNVSPTGANLAKDIYKALTTTDEKLKKSQIQRLSNLKFIFNPSEVSEDFKNDFTSFPQFYIRADEFLKYTSGFDLSFPQSRKTGDEIDMLNNVVIYLQKQNIGAIVKELYHIVARKLGLIARVMKARLDFIYDNFRNNPDFYATMSLTKSEKFLKYLEEVTEKLENIRTELHKERFKINESRSYKKRFI